MTMDIVGEAVRSRMMSGIRGSDTYPELRVRSYLHRRGLRFRKNVANLPGRPDIVLPKYRAVIMVHGCFWHQHRHCKYASVPSTNVRFWRRKLNRNVQRDEEKKRALRVLGWRVLAVWECQVTEERALAG